jgi:hypothetical protein
MSDHNAVRLLPALGDGERGKRLGQQFSDSTGVPYWSGRT